MLFNIKLRNNKKATARKYLVIRGTGKHMKAELRAPRIIKLSGNF